MRHVFRSLLEQILGIHRIRSDDFVGGDTDANVFVMALAAQRSDHHMLWQQSWPASFRDGDVNQWHDGAAQIENSHQVCRSKRQLCQQRPLQHFLDVQNRQAEPFAPAAEDARDGSLRSWPFHFLRGSHANRRTARSKSSRVKGLVTYPSAPCCWPQYLSLTESLEVTMITGIMLNSALPFRSRQIWNPFRTGITTSRRITLGRSFVMVSSTRFGSFSPMGQ